MSGGCPCMHTGCSKDCKCECHDAFDERPWSFFTSRYHLMGYCAPPGYKQLGSTWIVYDMKTHRDVARCTSYAAAVAAIRLFGHDEWKELLTQ